MSWGIHTKVGAAVDNKTVNRCFLGHYPVKHEGVVYTIEAVTVRRKERGARDELVTVLELRRREGKGRLFALSTECEEVISS